MCVKREGVGNLCGGLFTILMLIIMFSVAHRRFTELIYISLAIIAIALTLCIIIAIFNTLCKGEPLIDYWDSNTHYSTRHHSSRYRHHNHNNNNNSINSNNSHNHNNNNNVNNNGYNQQRVHVCAPPSMGGARLNIIYTIGQQNHANNHNVRNNRTVNTLDRHSVAINIDNNSNYSAHLWPTLTPLPLGGRRSPRSLSPRPSRTTPHDWHFPPIITVMANEESVDELQQIIDSYGDCDAIESRLPLNSDIMNGFDYQLPDLPPLYHQLDVIPTDGPPTYEEAIEEDKESTNK